MIRVVGFDLDGTLVNSIASIKKGCNNALKQMNLKTYSLKDYETFVGNGLIGVVNKIIEKEKYDNNIKDKLLDKFRKECSKTVLDDLTYYKGIEELLNYLDKKKYIKLIITNKEDFLAKKVYNDFILPIHFDGVYGTKDKVLKPNTDIFSDLAREYNFKKSEVLFIGDMKVDYDFAKNSEVEYIFCKWGFSKDIPENCKKVDCPKEIIDYLEKVNNV